MIGEREERLRELKEYEEKRWERLVISYDDSLDLYSVPLNEVKRLYERHHNSLGSFLRVIIGIKDSRKYLAKHEALKRAVEFKTSIQEQLERSDGNVSEK